MKKSSAADRLATRPYYALSLSHAAAAEWLDAGTIKAATPSQKGSVRGSSDEDCRAAIIYWNDPGEARGRSLPVARPFDRGICVACRAVITN